MIPRERITFEQATKKRRRTGEVEEEFIPVPELTGMKVERRKQQSSEGDGLNANEKFIGIKITLWVRWHPLINENMRIQYNGNPYQIIDLNRQFWDNSYTITCIKING